MWITEQLYSLNVIFFIRFFIFQPLNYSFFFFLSFIIFNFYGFSFSSKIEKHMKYRSLFVCVECDLTQLNSTHFIRTLPSRRFRDINDERHDAFFLSSLYLMLSIIHKFCWHYFCLFFFSLIFQNIIFTYGNSFTLFFPQWLISDDNYQSSNEEWLSCLGQNTCDESERQSFPEKKEKRNWKAKGNGV